MKVKRAGIGTKILIAVLLVACVTGLLSLRSRLNEAEAQRDQLQAQVQTQQEANSALADAIANSGDLEYIVNFARSKLGLLEPDEIRFVDTSN